MSISRQTSLRSVNENDDKNMGTQARDLCQISLVSKVTIYKVADKIEKGSYNGNEEDLLPSFNPVEIPEQEKFDFKLGDRVKFKKQFSLEDFKYIQNETLGWKKRLATVYGNSGIVTGYNSQYENGVNVYFPKIFITATVYAALLENKVTQLEDNVTPRSRWRVDDYVRTKTEQKVVDILLKKFPEFPRRYKGRAGRVIAVTTAGIFVTFNEYTSYAVNSALLERTDGLLEIPRTPRIIEDPEGHKIGNKVHVQSNLKDLIKKQRGKWFPEMFQLVGKEVKVTDVNGNGTIDVALSKTKSWRLSSDSVKKDDPGSYDKADDDVQHYPGDIVKVKIGENIGTVFACNKLPSIFFQYMRYPAYVKYVDGEYDPVIKFSGDQSNQGINVHASTLNKATKEETEKHSRIQAQVNNLRAKQQVYIDAGPPNYVRHILSEEKASTEVIEAMTNPSMLVGFTDYKHAVIKYKNGKMYEINRKYLTVPEKYDVTEDNQIPTLETIKELQEGFQQCVKTIHDIESDQTMDCLFTVDILTVNLQYTPPSFVFKVNSLFATSDRIADLLPEITGWEIEHVGIFYIKKGIRSFPNEVEVTLNLNDSYTEKVTQSPAFGTAMSEKMFFQCHASREAKAEAIGMDHSRDYQMPHEALQPRVNSLDQFEYFPLYHRSMSQNVYFPYFVQPSRGTIREDQQANQALDNNIHEITQFRGF